jgi:hypothetical protein
MDSWHPLWVLVGGLIASFLLCFCLHALCLLFQRSSLLRGRPFSLLSFHFLKLKCGCLNSIVFLYACILSFLFRCCSLRYLTVSSFSSPDSFHSFAFRFQSQVDLVHLKLYNLKTPAVQTACIFWIEGGRGGSRSTSVENCSGQRAITTHRSGSS